MSKNVKAMPVIVTVLTSEATETIEATIHYFALFFQPSIVNVANFPLSLAFK
jgi:hypothetical protein